MSIDENFFPKDVNFGKNLNNFIKYNQENTYVFGYIPNHTWNERYILNNLKKNYTDDEWDNSKLFYHGTNWSGAFSILDEIILSSRFTDFGRKIFYVSDSFKCAAKCSLKNNNQGAVIIFKPLNDWIDDISPSKIKVFSHRNRNIEDWKKFVYRCRNRQRPYEFENYHYISGAILANPEASLSEYKYISYGTDIPYQIALRTEELCEKLHSTIAGIIFFPQGIRRKDVFGM